MEWQVDSFLLVFIIETEKPDNVYDVLLDTILKIEDRWLDNEVVIQQIVTNFIVLSESSIFVSLHAFMLRANSHTIIKIQSS